jgi:D-alanyl-D-alanine dipeptidase
MRNPPLFARALNALGGVEEAMRILRVAFALVSSALAQQPPQQPAREWMKWIGEYQYGADRLIVLERDGKLTVHLKQYGDYPLTEVSQGTFRFPDFGIYKGKLLSFREGAHIGEDRLERRELGPENGNVFRIAPVRPVNELRREALAAHPPVESPDLLPPDLVDLASLDKTIRLDIRYASTDNFLSTPVYEKAQAVMQRPAAEALLRAHRRLRQQGYGLLIHDAYRPWYVTKIFWDATPADKHDFVADPSQGSRHNRGCAVDLTLYDQKSGKTVEMVGVYDEMSERSYPDYPGGTSFQRWHRALLRQAMEAEGFTVYEFEWWHFDYKDWRKYAIGNVAIQR